MSLYDSQYVVHMMTSVTDPIDRHTCAVDLFAAFVQLLSVQQLVVSSALKDLLGVGSFLVKLRWLVTLFSFDVWSCYR